MRSCGDSVPSQIIEYRLGFSSSLFMMLGVWNRKQRRTNGVIRILLGF